jgi:hypothetical protein
MLVRIKRELLGGLLFHTVAVNAVFCNTVSLPQIRPSFQPNRHTSVLLLYNRQKPLGRQNTPLLPNFYPTFA